MHFSFAIITKPSPRSAGRLYVHVLHCTVHMSHDVHVRVLHGDNSRIPGGETLKPWINPRFPVYLALIPGYREETLKPGIIPGNPVYLAGMDYSAFLSRPPSVHCHHSLAARATPSNHTRTQGYGSCNCSALHCYSYTYTETTCNRQNRVRFEAVQAETRV